MNHDPTYNTAASRTSCGALTRRTSICGALVAMAALVTLAARGARAEAEAAAPSRTMTRAYVHIPPLSLDVKAARADEVIHGVITAVTPDTNVKPMPETRYSVQLLNAMKGERRGQIDVRVGGVWTDEMQYEVIPAPHFGVGDEVVLFLYRIGTDGTFGVYGLDQGAFVLGLDRRVQAMNDVAVASTPLDAFWIDVMERWAQSLR
jgi:hypothetical protein